MRINLSIVLFVSLGLMGCASDYEYEEIKTGPEVDSKEKGVGKLFGEDTLTFGRGKKRNQEDAGICVNSYLWRASLDTISFMPIAHADPFGGVIFTDWYSPASSREQFKINIFILSRALRSDGLKVSIFRKEKNSSGQWVDQVVDPQTITELEKTILTRARHFRSTVVK